MLTPLLCVASCGLEIVPTASIVIGPSSSRKKKVDPLATRPGRGKSSDTGQSAHGEWGLFMQESIPCVTIQLVLEREDSLHGNVVHYILLQLILKVLMKSVTVMNRIKVNCSSVTWLFLTGGSLSTLFYSSCPGRVWTQNERIRMDEYALL